MQLLGYVNIDVSKTLNAKWYQEYRERKFKKMDLIIKEGIFRPRMLDYAEVILDVVNELSRIVTIGVLNKDIIGNYIKKVCSDKKIPITLVGQMQLTADVNGILTLFKTITTIKKQELKNELEYKNGKCEYLEYKQKKELIEGIKRDSLNVIKVQMDELNKLIKINQQYKETKDGTYT